MAGGREHIRREPEGVVVEVVVVDPDGVPVRAGVAGSVVV
jgi:hypothetical protein